MRTWILPFVLLLLAVPPLPARGEVPLRFGVLAVRPKAQTLARWQLVARYLEKTLGRRVELAAYDYEALNAAVARHSVDIVLTHPGHFIQLQRQHILSAPLATQITRPDTPDGQRLSSFGGVIFTRAKGPIASLSDLAGKRLAIADLQSIGGYQMQALELRDAGVPLPAGERLLVTGLPQDLTVAAVLSGRAEAGFVRTGLLEALVREGKLDPRSIRVVNRQRLPFFPYASSTRLYPEWPVAVLTTVDEQLCRRLAVALLSLGAESAAARSAGIYGFTIPADYGGVENLLRRLRMSPFDRAPEFTAGDLWERYAGWISGLSVMFLLLAGIGARLSVQNRRVSQVQLRFATLFECLPEPMWIISGGRFTECNMAAVRLLGYPDKQALYGLSPSNISPRRQPDGELSVLKEERLFRAALAGEPQHFEWLHLKADGSNFVAEVSLAPTMLDGRTVVLCAWHDITKRKAGDEKLHRQEALLRREIAERQSAQESLAEQQRQLEELNRSLEERIGRSVAELRQKDQLMITQSRQAAMGEMIGNIAHQWRQPLNALGLLLANIKDAFQYQELDAAYLDEAVASGNRLVQKMSATINDFRNFFHPGKESVVFSACKQIDDAISLVRPSFDSDNIQIGLEAPGDLSMYGFPNEYSQVLLNLFSNAKDAIQASGVSPGRVEVVLAAYGGRGCVTVRDNGGGIPEESLDRIFEPYFSTKAMGTGIGLYMSKMIIERNMGGTITAANREGGAEFTVLTPLALDRDAVGREGGGEWDA